MELVQAEEALAEGEVDLAEGLLQGLSDAGGEGQVRSKHC